MALRKNFVFLTASERARLASAFNAVNASGFLASPADQHTTNFNSGIHWGSAFLPWHRWFLLRLEQEMPTGQPGVMIPFWDWTRSDSRNIDIEPWKSFFGGQQHRWSVRPLDLHPIGHPGSDVPPARASPRRIGFRDHPRLDTATFAQFRAIESSGGHGGGHNWVGGTMAGGRSPADPLFWLHHGNIDRLWAIWQRNHPGAAQYTTDPAVGDSVAAAMVPLNSPMIGEATPASMLDHRTHGYAYDTDVRLEGIGIQRTPRAPGHR